MSDKIKSEVSRLLGYQDRTLVRGWRLSGVGPCRHGWWAETAAGNSQYLGKTLSGVLSALQPSSASGSPR